MLGTCTRSGFRRGCGPASWRPPSDLVDQVHVSGALSGAHTGKGPPDGKPTPNAETWESRSALANRHQRQHVQRMFGTSTRSGFRRGCGRASWRPPLDLVDQVHVSGALSGARTGKGPPDGKPTPNAETWESRSALANRDQRQHVQQMLGTSKRSGFRRGCGRASWRPPSDLVDQVHVSGALSGACTGKGRQMANPRPTPKPENLGPPWPPGTSGNPAGYSRSRPLRGLKMIVGSFGIPWG